VKSKLIAPCGMNCDLCIAYLRDKNKCPGCNFQGKPDSDYFKKCSIKNCDFLKDNKLKFCSDKCERFPCKRLKNLDKRYRTRYEMSMIENLKEIKENGVKKFLKKQEKKYKCPECGNTICVHNRKCYSCGFK